MTARRLRRDDQGSIAIFMIIMMVATGMTAAMLVQVNFGMRVSRRAGDSANALQVADAGVNEAVQQAAFVAGTQFTRTGTVGNGSYTYTATQDTQQTNVWHVDATGIDATGVKRHVQADAYGQSEFTSPMYVKNFLSVGAGALLDSYASGVSNTTGCTRKGIISMADGSKVSFTSGGKGNANCTGRILDPTWTFSMDGCTVYSSTNPFPPTGQANCPPAPYTTRLNQTFPTTSVQWPTTGITSPANGKVGTSFLCSALTPFNAGGVYAYQTVTLTDGCYINWGTLSTSDYYKNPVVVYANDFEIGSATKSVANAPSASTCPWSTAGWSYADAQNNSPTWYCAGWSQTLQLRVPDGSNTAQVNFNGTGTAVWAIINAPSASVTLKSPQLQMFGAMVANSVDVKSQFSWHYDETLTSVTTGKFSLYNWREVPQS
jgi:hypothetical protein